MTLIPKSVCVYCGSRPGARPGYMLAAKATGEVLARNQWRLVYGAGDVGLMGQVAQSVQVAGGTTFGVIPAHLVAKEVGRTNLDSYVITETMHERKKVMFMNADAIVMLPGGAGSLDEFFEAVTWRQLGMHKKPVILLNVEGYWDGLITMIDTIIREGFADASLKDYITVASDLAGLEDALRRALS